MRNPFLIPFALMWATEESLLAEKARKAAGTCCNKSCPVDGKPINSKLVPLSWKPLPSPEKPEPVAVLVGFCSQQCMDAFKANQQKYSQSQWLEQPNKSVKR